MLRVLLALFVAKSVSGQCSPLSMADYVEFKTLIKAHIATLATPDTCKNCPNPNARSDFIGGAVRLSFHDAGTYRNGQPGGGPDGCLDLNDPDNGGLEEVIQFLQPFYTPTWQAKFNNNIADFWAAAANAAAEHAHGAPMTFRTGRFLANCSAIDTRHRLPNAMLAWAHVQDVFGVGMNFTDKEIVALLGAHSLGRTEPQNSGFSGPWTITPDVLSTQFYLGLETQAWFKFKPDFSSIGLHTNTTQWASQNYDLFDPPPSLLATQTMFLTADMSLVVANAHDPGCVDSSFILNPGMAKGTCQENTVTRPMINEYIGNPPLFLNDFAKAFQKLQEVGEQNLLGLCGTAVPDPPRNFSASVLSRSSIQLRWTPGFANGATVTGHVVAVTQGGQTRELDASATGVFILPWNGAAATITVQSVNSVGRSTGGLIGLNSVTVAAAPALKKTINPTEAGIAVAVVGVIFILMVLPILYKLTTATAKQAVHVAHTAADTVRAATTSTSEERKV